MEKVRLGIVGLGRLGREHAANINYNITNAELAAVCSAIPDKVESIMKEMNPGYGTTDYMELFNDRNLDGVVIASNSAYHCKMICDAANAGVEHIYCENPLGMTLEEIDLIIGTCEKNNVLIFQIGYNRRFERSLIMMKQKMEKGLIGKPILIKMANRDSEWEQEALLKFSPTSGGLVFDMLTHDYDTARYHIEVEVFGTKGCLRMSTIHNNDRIISMSVNGITTDCEKWPFEFWEPTLKAELQDIVDCIENGSQPRVGLIDGYKATQWALAAKEAVDKRMIVKIK